jgi:23S rRNA (cytidine1920-2'-O)/16S rRNA (cytidine1409-2'-O)-methyltransferase
MKKMRIDILLVEKGLVDSRSQAQRLVMAGQVKVDGQLVPKPSVSFPENVKIIIEPGQRFASRGGEKLAAALNEFSIDVRGKVCADVGASTGGFTDCLLQYGAQRVYAIDVGRGILHWNLRQDDRVIVMEGINARYLEKLPEQVDLVTIDASFISLKVLLPVVKAWFDDEGGDAIVLIKPQFEAGKSEAARGKGVIRDVKVHEKVIFDVLSFADEAGYQVMDVIKSPLKGPKGNIEFLAGMKFPAQDRSDIRELISTLINTLSTIESDNDGDG